MLMDTLRADWTARGTSARVSALPEFANGALILGAGTKLAEARGERRDEAAESERAVALVSVAIGRPLDASAAAHARRALAKAHEGDAALALTHLALAGVGCLTEPREDARRLFIADGLMKAGVPPATILAVLADAPSPDALDRAYNPKEPRVPAGNGRPSGRWTSGDWSDEGADEKGAEAPNPSPKSPADRETGVQIADASPNFAQYLNPVGEAQAANWDDVSGKPPNTRHDVGVALTVQRYRDNGFIILSEGPVAVTVPGFATPRIYDCLVLDPGTGRVIADEEKTTIYDVIFLKEEQVAKDVAIDRFGGFAPGLGGGIRVDRVAYSAHCFGCRLIDLRPLRLWDELQRAGINIWFEYLPDRPDYH
jgi:hypothetical protein